MVQIHEVYFFHCTNGNCRAFARQVATFTPAIGADVAELIREQAFHQCRGRPRCHKCGSAPPVWRFEHFPPHQPPPPSGSPDLDAARRGQPLPGSISVVRE
jgi:hypothetical protein